MKQNNWKFTSTTEQFDGSRIIKKAIEAGLHVLTIRRKNQSLTIVTEKFMIRVRRANLYVPDEWTGESTVKRIEIKLSDNGELLCAYWNYSSSNTGYVACWVGRRSITTFIKELEKIEATMYETKIYGWK